MSPEAVVSINQNHADRATSQRRVKKQTAYKRRRRPNWHFWNRFSVCSQRQPFSTPLITVCQVYMGSCTAGRLSTWAGVGLGAKHQPQSQLCSHRWSFTIQFKIWQRKWHKQMQLSSIWSPKLASWGGRPGYYNATGHKGQKCALTQQ